MLDAFHLNKLQRKVLLVIVLIILLPMLVTGILSGRWVSARIDESIEHWLRESSQLDEGALSNLHRNARLFIDTLKQVNQTHLRLQHGQSPIPENLQPLASELGINLVQVISPAGDELYSSRPTTLLTSWAPGQDTAVVKVKLGAQQHLAAITISRIPAGPGRHYRLILGTLFDKAFVDRMSRLSGLKTRLFYPDKGDFTRAFAEDGKALKISLPADAYAQLQNKQPYYSANAENGRFWGLYLPVVDASGQVEAIWFSGYERTRKLEFLTDEVALTLAIIFFGLLLALGVGYMLSRVVVRPVEYLHEGVMRLAAQDFRAEIPIHSKDELGELARAFNAMANSLRESRNEQQREFRRDKLTALGELSLAMAHEIRNPIGVINTASRLLTDAKDEKRKAELSRVIQEESQRLNHLLNDFQQLARHRKPEFTDVDPVEPLEKAMQVILAGHNEINVTRHYEHGNLQVSVDSELLRQAWLNLLRNALEAMGDKGGELQVGTQVQENSVEVYLQDSGPGIAIEKMTRLFEPFFTTKEQGSGLGLSIANTLIEANGAQLEYVPGDWSGARFVVRIPVVNEEKG